MRGMTQTRTRGGLGEGWGGYERGLVGVGNKT